MKLYAAIDLHSNNSVLVVIDEEDRVVLEKRVRNDLALILEQFEPYRATLSAIAVESTFNWYWLVDGLMDAGYEVKLVNTVAVKVYDGKKHTGDEHDARHLAHLLRHGLLPTGHIYPKEERAVRDLLRKRSQLMRTKVAQILSLQNQASRNRGQGLKTGEIRSLEEQDMLALCGGDELKAHAMRSNLAVLRCVESEIAGIEREVLSRVKMRPSFELLTTVCGIGKILGMTIMLEAGSMERFVKVGRFASYARCVGSSRWSNGKKKGEGNRKNGNKYLSWAFVEAAHFSVRYSERARRFFERKRAKTNAVVAIKAVAHKLARACYHVLKDQTPFDEARAFA